MCVCVCVCVCVCTYTCGREWVGGLLSKVSVGVLNMCKVAAMQ